jgi:hypothetical protein
MNGQVECTNGLIL